VDGAGLTRLSTATRHRPPLVHSLAAFVVPTYLQPHFPDVDAAENDFRRYTTLEATLTTNSAFAAMVLALGTMWAFMVVGFACLVAAAFAGHASRYRSSFFIAVFVVSYAFAELWRVYLFNYGLLEFLLALLVIVPFIHRPVVALRRRLPYRGALERR
jgi:hypothetical protein